MHRHIPLNVVWWDTVSNKIVSWWKTSHSQKKKLNLLIVRKTQSCITTAAILDILHISKHTIKYYINKTHTQPILIPTILKGTVWMCVKLVNCKSLSLLTLGGGLITFDEVPVSWPVLWQNWSYISMIMGRILCIILLCKTGEKCLYRKTHVIQKTTETKMIDNWKSFRRSLTFWEWQWRWQQLYSSSQQRFCYNLQPIHLFTTQVTKMAMHITCTTCSFQQEDKTTNKTVWVNWGIMLHLEHEHFSKFHICLWRL